MTDARATHWDETYVGADEHSWDQHTVERSLTLLTADGVPGSVVDIGGGDSPLAGTLLDAGVAEVAVLDVSAVALEHAAARLGERAEAIVWIAADVTRWTPERRYDAWHDRAVFHFLTDPADRLAYRERLHAAVAPGGRAVVATFAADGPQACSGLPTARYDAAALIAELGLVDATSDRELHRTPWGEEQPFTWVAGHVPR